MLAADATGEHLGAAIGSAIGTMVGGPARRHLPKVAAKCHCNRLWIIKPKVGTHAHTLPKAGRRLLSAASADWGTFAAAICPAETSM